MKKRDIGRRLRTMLSSVREYFLEEEPRDKAKRTLKDAGICLNKTVYRRIALEYELQHRSLDDETRAWTETTLEAVRHVELQQSQQLAVLREEYRKLALQDLLYHALNEPDGDTFQQAHEALMELSATVETEKSVQSISRLLESDMQRPNPIRLEGKHTESQERDDEQ